MSNAKQLVHIQRWAPTWATSEPIMECGNQSGLEATTFAEYETYRDKECRGSSARAMARYCVTCVQTATNHQSFGTDADSIRLLARYLEQRHRGERGRPPRVVAEVEAIALLLDAHSVEWAAAVESLLGVSKLSDQRQRRTR